MKTVPFVAIVFCAIATSATAASLSFSQNDDAISFYVDGEAQNGAFDTIFFQARPIPPAAFTNQNSGLNAGVPRPAGQAFTYTNRMLTADPLDFPGGLALTQVGLINTPQELSFAVGKLGGTITTANEPNGDLFLANVNLPGSSNFSARAAYTVQLISAGVIVAEFTNIPEPSSMVVVATGALILAAARRQRRRRAYPS